MASYTASVTSDRPPEEVFRYLADFRTVQEWDPSITASTHTGGGPPATVGSRYRVVTHVAGHDTELDYETVESVSPSRIVLRGENESAVSVDTITIEAETDGGCTVTYEADVTLKGVRKLADPVMGRVLERLGHDARDGLAEKLRR